MKEGWEDTVTVISVVAIGGPRPQTDVGVTSRAAEGGKRPVPGTQVAHSEPDRPVLCDFSSEKVVPFGFTSVSVWSDPGRTETLILYPESGRLVGPSQDTAAHLSASSTGHEPPESIWTLDQTSPLRDAETFR